MAELFKVNAPVRKPLFEGVQGENEARSIQFDITPWVEELGDGAVTATAKRSQDSQPYPVTVTKDGTTVTWKPTSTDTAFAGVGSFQLEYTVDSVLAKTCIWSTMVAPSLDPAGDPPDPYENWLAEMREIAADALQSEQNAEDSAENAEAWAVGQRGGVDVPSTDSTYENNSKYWAEQSLANQYGAYIVKSASGDIASFNDGADNVPMKSVNVTITPKQSGSGDPSPSNVRPITGWTDAGVTVAGKNIIGNIAFGNVPSVVSGEIVGAQGWATDFIKIDNSNPICMSVGVNNASSYLLFYDKQKTYLGYLVMYSETTTPLVSTNFPQYSSAEYVKVRCDNTSSVNPYAQLEVGTTATAYEPYTGHTTPVPLGQTVYGGEVNVTTGVVTITKGYADFGQLNWIKGSGIIFTAAVPNLKFQRNATLAIEAISNEYKPVSKVYAQGAGVNVNYIMRSDNSESRVYVNNSDYATLEDFKTAMSGVQLVYELETPTAVQLTPAQVASLLGTNNVWADCGDIAVEYRADPTLAYNELANVIVSLGGNL